MKRIFVLSLVLVLSLGLCACQKAEPTESNKSNVNSSEEYKTTLIRNLTASEDVNNIEALNIKYMNSMQPVLITDKKDIEFLQKYEYVGEFPRDRQDEILVFPPYCSITVTVSGYESSFYLLKDGSIAKKIMCGDSELDETNIGYELYSAKENYCLNEERLIELLKKYDGYMR